MAGTCQLFQRSDQFALHNQNLGVFSGLFLAYILKIHEQKLLCNFVARTVQNMQLQKLQCAQQDPARF